MRSDERILFDTSPLVVEKRILFDASHLRAGEGIYFMLERKHIYKNTTYKPVQIAWACIIKTLLLLVRQHA